MRLSSRILLAIIFLLSPLSASAQQPEEEPEAVREAVAAPPEEEEEGVVFPTNTLAPLTERFILDEVRNLRVEFERMKQDMIREITDRQLDTTDRALSFSSNTVNFFFFLVTLGAALLAAFGWRTVQDLKGSAKQMIDREVQAMLKKSQDQFRRIEDDLKNKEKEIAKNQEEVKKMQRMSTLWLQVNREKDDRKRLEMLDEILTMDPDLADAYIMKAGSYLRMGIPDQAIDMCDLALNIKQDQSLAHYYKARALTQTERYDEALAELHYAITLAPMLRESMETEADFEKIHDRPEFQELSLRGGG